MNSKVVPCSCKNEGQDKIHGQGRRVANWSVKNKAYRCTVCKTLHTPKGESK